MSPYEINLLLMKTLTAKISQERQAFRFFTNPPFKDLFRKLGVSFLTWALTRRAV
jgi:hypothetical protein